MRHIEYYYTTTYTYKYLKNASSNTVNFATNQHYVRLDFRFIFNFLFEKFCL